MRVIHIPALEDNYMYLLIDDSTNQAAIVDPVEPDKVIEAVQKENVTLTTILTTHHHWDHAGGNKGLVAKVKGLEVYGGDDRVGGLTQKASHNQTFKVGSLSIRCLHTPCHTSGHICFFVESPNDVPVVFTGDTLFVAGCGKFFEGTAEQMYTALVDILGNLPPNTKVYCGHEYTVSNLKFAESVDGSNRQVMDKLQWAMQLREKKIATVPSTIADEIQFNPFMRVNEKSIQARCGTSNGIETMAYLREEKNKFKARV